VRLSARGEYALRALLDLALFDVVLIVVLV
jgi:hypothetical protein